MHPRASLGSVALGIVALGLLGACGAADSKRDQQNLDGPAASPAGEPVPVVATIVHRDDRTGLPRFAWLDVKAASKGLMKGKPARDAAWGTLRGVAKTYGLKQEVVASAEIESLHDTGTGPVIARFKQRLDGIDVFRSQLNIALSRDLDPVAASGSLARIPRGADRRMFTLAPRAAVAAAARAFGTKLGENDVSEGGALSGEFGRYTLRRGALGDRREVAPTRAKKVWFDGLKGLVPGYYVEIHLGTDAIGDAQLRSFVVSAVDGTVLYQQSMTASDAYDYRVYGDAAGPRALYPHAGPQGSAGIPHPTGAPTGFDPVFVPQNLVSLSSFPFSQNDPWLPAGATETTGNNVDAFANLVAPDGYAAGDLRPTTTGPNAFDYPYDHAQQPGSATNVQAGAVQLFYTLNFLHDWFYDAGYDEASNNPQADNYGRGGVAGDPLTAQAQDVGGRNNANASTPADGASPRIRMYVFDGIALKKLVTPAGDKEVGTVAWGPKAFLQSGALAEVSPALGCDPIDNPADVVGKIALIDRGVCSAQIKVQNAQAAGAIGVVIANNQVGAPPSFTAVPGIDPATTSIPTLTVGQTDGADLHAAVALGPVEVTLRRDEAIDKDGSLDTSVVIHEWAHTLSNRLVGNGNGLTGIQARGMGEGWSDFVALLALTSAENAAVPSNPDWSGTFGIGGYDLGGAGNDGYYFGIRRVPYSVALTKNPLTFKHIENGVALPATAPIAFGHNGANNAEVHNTGEVWATMLWECYVSLLRDPRFTFEQANERMRKYLIAGLKLTPLGPSITEARDALLAATYATDKQDYNHFALAFARRGAGVGAKSPAHESETNAGVVESYVTGADVDIVSAKIEGIVSPCNPYGILRNGEHGKLTVTLRNAGTAPLLATTMTVSSPGGELTFPGGAVLNAPPILPHATLTTETDVLLEGVGFAATVATQIDVTDPDLAVPRTVSLTYSADFNYDVALESSRTDLLDTPVSTWTVASDPGLDMTFPWALVPEGTKQRWMLRNSATTSDHSLVTPDLLVAGAGFKVTFDHRYSFESSSGRHFDGAVLEASTDGGVNWTDIGALASPGYNGIIDFDGSTNPLKSRAAFTAQSVGYPAYHTATVALGVAFNGSTVKVRFRAGTDEGTGAIGWDITRASFDGTTNTPFPSRVPVAACVVDPGVLPLGGGGGGGGGGQVRVQVQPHAGRRSFGVR
jgi:large repetitive protein